MKRLAALGLVLLFCLAMFPLGPGVAQGEVRLSSLWVRLWPEYDQPGLLVIYVGELAEATTYPAIISLRMPARVAAPHVVAVQPSPEAPIDETTFEVAEEGPWQIVTFQANGPRFQFEYYDTLGRDGNIRQPSFTWPGDYAVDQLLVELQQPPHASELSIDPALSTAQVSADDGLTYHVGQFGPLEAGALLGVQIRYVRDEDTLTVDLLGALPVEGTGSSGSAPVVGASPSGASGGVDALLLALVAVVSFLLGAAAMRVAVNLQAGRRRR